MQCRSGVRLMARSLAVARNVAAQRMKTRSTRASDLAGVTRNARWRRTAREMKPRELAPEPMGAEVRFR